MGCTAWLIRFCVAAKVLLVASDISTRSLAVHIEGMQTARAAGELPHLNHAVVIQKTEKIEAKPGITSYAGFLDGGRDCSIEQLSAAEMVVRDEDVVNVQFTSGTTGRPKAALLTHRYVELPRLLHLS